MSSIRKRGHMKQNCKNSHTIVRRTVVAILATAAGRCVPAADAASVGPAPIAESAAISSIPAPSQLQQVIVTATRREEDIQNVPTTIQALTGTTLQQLNVQTLTDFLKFLPNVTTGSEGPGMGNVVMRGISSSNIGAQAFGVVALMPNVATYLDNQSVMLPGRNLDVYSVDLQRVEIDEGPQMFFGAGAEAGAIRYITNQPSLNTTEVEVNASRGVTAHGDPNTAENAVFNLPLVPGKFAARLVLFLDRRGGYINNLPATFSRDSTDVGIYEENGGIVPISEPINNYNLTGNAINPLTYQGIRTEVLYKVNDDWNALLSVMSQNTDAQGVFYQMPFSSVGAKTNDVTGVPGGTVRLPDLSVNLFEPSYSKDKFVNTALTVNGTIGQLNVVYAGSYLDRNIEQQQDYSGYSRGRYQYYYQCTGVSYSNTSGNPSATCASPGEFWRELEQDKVVQQELRLSTPRTWRLRGIAGLFYSDLHVGDDTRWQMVTLPYCSPGGATSGCFLPVTPFAPAVIPGEPGMGSFIDDFTRVVKQRDAYISADFDIIPHTLTITGGIRYFDLYNSEVGGAVSSTGCKIFNPSDLPPVVNGGFGVCPAPFGANFKDQPHSFTQTGHLGRGSLAWHITSDKMVYYTYSQGYRPGGFDDGNEALLPDKNGVPQFISPLKYTSDILTNQEFGWRTEWFDHRLRFNGTFYNDIWSNAQVIFFAPQAGFGILGVGTNGPKYRVRGVELQLAANPIRGLTVDSSVAVNSGHQINTVSVIDNNPANPNYGKPVTTRYVNGTAVPVLSPFGVRGTDLALCPPLKWHLWAKYEWPMGSYVAFVQAGVQHQAQSVASTNALQAYRLPLWTTVDAGAGVSKDDWTVSISASNITNQDKSLFTSSNEFILTETPMRPRVITLAFSYNWSQHE